MIIHNVDPSYHILYVLKLIDKEKMIMRRENKHFLEDLILQDHREGK